MRKTAICIVFLATVCCIVIPVNGQTARKNANTHKKNRDNAQPPKIDTVNADTVNVMKLNIPQQPEATGKPDDNKKESQSYFRRLIAPENLPNLILCVVGIAGICVAVKTLMFVAEQTIAMKKQLEAMQDQTTLQEIQLRQWVDIQNWQVIRRIRQDDGRKILDISFDIVNPTKMILTLEVVTATIAGQGYALRERVSLAPGNSHEGDISIRLTEEQDRQYLESKLVLPVIGAVWFTDGQKKADEWRINGMLVCNKTAAHFIRMGELIAEESTEQNNQHGPNEG